MNSKLRCKGCKDYFLREEIDGFGVCSDPCRDQLLTKKRKVRSSRRRSSTTIEVRQKIRRRDGQRCRWCCAKTHLHVHHILYRSEGGPDDPNNLITLCLSCHTLVHTKKWYYQPILLGLIWMMYVEGKSLTGPQFIRRYPELVPEDPMVQLRVEYRKRDDYGRPFYRAEEIPPQTESLAHWRGKLTHDRAVVTLPGDRHNRLCVGGWIPSGEWWLHCGRCRPEFEK